MRTEYRNDPTMDPSGFVLLADYVPQIVQEIRYYSTYNFIGERIDGYEEPCALLTIEAARALKAVSSELVVQGYRLKVFDAYRPACAVRQFGPISTRSWKSRRFFPRATSPGSPATAAAARST